MSPSVNLKKKIVKKNKNILKEARRKSTSPIEGFPRGTVVNNLPANAGDTKDVGSIRGWGKIPWNRKWQPTLAFLTGKFHGQRSLVGYSPSSRKQSDITEQLTQHMTLLKLKKKLVEKNYILFIYFCAISLMIAKFPLTM